MLDLLGSGSGVENDDLNEIQRCVGEHFLDDLARSEETREQEKHHQKIRGDAIARHEGDRAFALCQVAPWTHRPVLPGSAIVRIMVAQFMESTFALSAKTRNGAMASAA